MPHRDVPQPVRAGGQRDDAPVGQHRHDDRGQPGHGSLDVQAGVGQLGAHGGQHLEAGGRGRGAVLVGAAAGHVQEVQPEAVGGGDGAHVVPASEVVVVGLDRHRLAGGHRVLVALPELALLEPRVGLPHQASDQLLAAGREDRGRLAVEVGHVPPGVHGDEAGGHPLEQPGGLVAGGAQVGDVVDGADEADGRAVGAGQRAAAAGDPPLRTALREHEAVLRAEVADGGERVVDRRVHSRSVLGVDAAEAPLQRQVLVSAEAEQHPHALVELQVVLDDVPVEGAHAGRVERDVPAQPARAVLRRQRLQLQLGHDRVGQLLEQRDVVRRPRPRLRRRGTERPERPAGGRAQRDPEVGAGARVVDDQRLLRRDGARGERVLGRGRDVGQHRDLHGHRRGHREQPRGQVGQPSERPGLQLRRERSDPRAARRGHRPGRRPRTLGRRHRTILPCRGPRASPGRTCAGPTRPTRRSAERRCG